MAAILYKMALCISFDGGCTPKATQISETLTKNLTENITNTMVNLSNSSGAYITGKQTVNISNVRFNCAGGVNIGGISQKMVASIDFNKLTNSVSENTLKQSLQSAVQKSVEADQSVKTAFLGGAASTEAQSKTLNENISKLANSYTYNDFLSDVQQAKSLQETNLTGIDITSSNPDKPCTLGDISQDITLSILSKNIAEKMIKNAGSSASRLDLDLSESAKQSVVTEGPGEALAKIFAGIGSMFTQPILMMLFVFILFVAIIIGAYKLATW